jgi:transposase|tara:strand:+ start:55 stop:1161 length:1107 start_codon:yes stop_codon:yes gene_type:complete
MPSSFGLDKETNDMGRTAPAIELDEQDRQILLGWTRAGSTEQRLAFRAKIILSASGGTQSRKIALELDTREATVSKWRNRFLVAGIQGLQDSPRSGKPPLYTKDTEKSILSALDEPPPKGYATWTGSLLAKKLGISEHHVWRILREHKLSLSRRRSWCISTDPEFVSKAAAIVGVYLDPPENAVVLCVDEKPAIQALERAQGWLKLPNGKALTGFNHEYKRNGTTTLFAALNTVTGLVKAGHFPRRRRRQFLEFMNELVKDYPDQEIHVILDNLNTHKPKTDRWLPRHPNVHFYYTPTHASWLNQIEIWFSILWRQALRGGSFTSIRELRQAISDFIEAYNQTAHPFEWKATKVLPTKPKRKYADLCN